MRHSTHKTVFTVVSLLCFFSSLIFVQQKTSTQNKKDSDESTSKTTFNEELAKSLGADDYGMKSYVFCVLKTGKEEIKDEKKRNEIFRGHFSNMSRLAKEGKLVVAGPFVEGAPKRGMYIFNVTTIEEASAMVKTDPAVEAGIFEFELTKLYCSAALMKINEIHNSIQKTPVQ